MTAPIEFTVAEVAVDLRMSGRFVRDEIKRGRLRAVKRGGQWRVSLRDLSTYKDRGANVEPAARTG